MNTSPIAVRPFAFRSPRPILIGLLSLFLISASGCDGEEVGEEGVFEVELSWDQSANLDLFVWAGTGECSRHRCIPGTGTISSSAANDMGPETYESPFSATQNLRYAIGVNYHGDSAQPVFATIRVTTQAETRTFGPFELTQPDGGAGGCPVRDNTSSWWRPTDVRVDGTSVSLIPANTTITSNLQSAVCSGP